MSIDLTAAGDFLDDLLEQIAAQQDALVFYAESAHWEHTETEGIYTPGPAIDGGKAARAALGGAA